MAEPNPDCPACRGRGLWYSPDTGERVDCLCYKDYSPPPEPEVPTYTLVKCLDGTFLLVTRTSRTKCRVKFLREVASHDIGFGPDFVPWEGRADG